MSNSKSYAQEIAQRLIAQLRQGTAPWQKPWQAGETKRFLPVNPLTGKYYRGINMIHLMSKQYGDPRWLTYNQALELGAQVRKGEKSTTIQYWKFSEEQLVRDHQGNPIRKENGEYEKIEAKLERPKTFFAHIFNAEQIDNLPALVTPPIAWDPIEKVEELVNRSGATLRHSESNRAFYNPSSDSIYMPPKDCFATPGQYYATLLHELCHFTGHASRLNRDLGHPFGSIAYAKEELRAEIASMMLGESLGIGHDSEQHAAYVGSWIRILEDEPLELFRAASDAEKIRDYVYSLNLKQEIPIGEPPMIAQEEQVVATAITDTKNPIPLYIPFAEKDLVKALAGRLADGKPAISWDKEQKRWFANPGADLEKLSPWLKPQSVVTAPALSPPEEFAKILSDAGFTIGDEHPIFDGQKHRVKVADDKPSQYSGFYVAFQDGTPAGYFKNNRTGEEGRWRAKGYSLNHQDKAYLEKELIQKREQRRASIAEEQERVATETQALLNTLPTLTEPSPYMLNKGMQVIEGLYQRDVGEILVPAQDIRGKIWTMQRIDAEGGKRFSKGGRKEGCFFVIGGFDALQRAKTIIIAEGLATAYSISKALNTPVVVAFDAGNLKAVSQSIREVFPTQKMLIAGDDDRHLEQQGKENIGKVRAMEAAELTNATAIFPEFRNAEQKLHAKKISDFNDLVQNSTLGYQAVQKLFEQHMQSSPKPHLSLVKTRSKVMY